MAYVEELGNNKYKIYVDMGYVRGKRKRKTKTVTVTSNRDLNKKVREFELQCMQEMDEPIDNISFISFVEKWKENHVKIHLKQTSLEIYEETLNAGILDYFGNLKMKDIRKYHLVEYFAKEEKEGAKRLAVKLTVLKSIFSKAVEWEVIKENPTTGLVKPKEQKKKVNFYNEEELEYLFYILKNENPKYSLIIKLAAIGGLRKAETVGIREESINYEENYIYVDKQLRYSRSTKEFYLSPVKNNKPRKVFFPESFMEELKTYHTHFKEKRLAMGNLWNPLKDEEGNPINLLFVKDDGYPAQLSAIWDYWTNLIKKHKLKKITFHELRHSCASLMVKKGINFKVIQERLGHSNIGVTLDLYSHLEEDLHKESTNVFKDIL